MLTNWQRLEQQQQRRLQQGQQQQRPWCTYGCVHAHSAADHHAAGAPGVLTLSAAAAAALPPAAPQHHLPLSGCSCHTLIGCPERRQPRLGVQDSVGGSARAECGWHCFPCALQCFACIRNVSTHSCNTCTKQTNQPIGQPNNHANAISQNPRHHRPLDVLHTQAQGSCLFVCHARPQNTMGASATPEPAYACTRIIRGCIQSMYPS